MQFDDFLQRFQQVKGQGYQRTALCPGHDDDRNSLSIGYEKGKILLHCFAGCNTGHVLTSVGLKLSDLQNGTGDLGSKKKVQRRIVATYDYRDANGKLLYQTVRYEPKDFSQRRPDGNGGWIWNTNGVSHVLYQLPKLMAADSGQWVFLSEGEKDVDNLYARGLTATCNVGGAANGKDAKKWKRQYNESLRGHSVCILPDNDAAGRGHTQTLVQNLSGIVARLKVLELPGLPDKGDVSDWFETGGDAAKLLELVERTPDYAGRSDEIGLMLVEHPTHDHGNAEVVNILYRNRFAYCQSLGWLSYQDTHWQADNAEFEVNRAITEALKMRRKAAVDAEREDVVKHTTPNESRKNAVKGMFRDLVVTSLGDFDNDPDVLNCINGVIDLRTGELVAHDPSNRFTYCVRTPYLPKSRMDLWLKFLSESVGNYDEIFEWLQMAYGYSITGQTREECLFYIEGPSRSGKGTSTHVSLTLLGQPLATGVDFGTFTKSRDGDSQNFDLAPLRAARFISASESGRYSSLNEAVVKSITGNDPITAAFKHRDPFTYIPRFKIWLSSNHPARGDVDDDAFWGRLRVIRFPNSHLGNEDKTLKWRMCSPENLVGILAWMVEGARRWYASDQGLVTPFAVHAATQAHRTELDHVQQWLDECTKPEDDGIVTALNLYESYEPWCEKNGHMAKKAVAFGRALVAKGLEQCMKRIGDRTHRAYRGLLLRDSLRSEDG